MSIDVSRTREAAAGPAPEERTVRLDSPVWDPAAARSWERRYTRRLLLCDVLAVSLSLMLTFAAVQADSRPGNSVVTSLFLLILWVLLLGAAGARDPRTAMVPGVQSRRTLIVTLALFGAVAMLATVAGWETAREHLMLSMPVGLALLLGLRRISRSRLGNRSQRSWEGTRRALVLGERSKVEHLVSHLDEEGPRSGYKVIDTAVLPGCGVPRAECRDEVSAAVDAVTRAGADAVILASSDGLDVTALRELGWRLAALDVSLVMAPALNGVANSRLHTESVGGLPMVHVVYPRINGCAALAKRAFDIIFSLAVLAVILPVLALIAMAVVIDSRGPVLFRQERVGIHHSRFTMFKIRSMAVDAEERRAELLTASEGNDVLFKMFRDPRVTRIGRWLRRFSLDELPQFLNVLRGDMSVVGPRPPLPEEVMRYDEQADRRLLVKPGITGLWQVHGRSDLSWEDSLRLDLYYVENWSLAADLSIVLKTMRVVVTGAGAY